MWKPAVPLLTLALSRDASSGPFIGKETLSWDLPPHAVANGRIAVDKRLILASGSVRFPLRAEGFPPLRWAGGGGGRFLPVPFLRDHQVLGTLECSVLKASPQSPDPGKRLTSQQS